MKHKIYFLIVLLFSQPVLALQYYRMGSGQDAVAKIDPAYCLAGGDSDDTWASGWKFWLDSAKGADVLIIRADSDRGEYDSWIYNDLGKHNFPKVNSVTTLVFDKSDDGNDPLALKAIQEAEAIFFAGGDQSLYVEWFFNSKTGQELRNSILQKKVSVAGSSAGMAIMSGLVYAGRLGSPHDPDANVKSDEVLADPTAQFVDIIPNIIELPYLGKVIAETHFSQRDRFGRLIGFMAKAVYLNLVPDSYNVRGIGIDGETAFCYNRTGQGRVYGSGSVFFTQGQSGIEVLKSNRPLTWFNQGQAVQVQTMNSQSQIFDIRSWYGSRAHTSFWSVLRGKIYSN